MLAIVGVVAALVIVIVGASTIAALNRGVPKELWAIGGALSGALVGILAPPPRTRTSGKEKGPLSAAEATVTAANQAASKRAQVERYAGQAVVQGAERGLQAVTQSANERKASLEAAPTGDPALGGSPRDASKSVVATFERALERVGPPAQDAPTDHVLDAERAVHEAAVQGASEHAAVQQTEPEGREAAKAAAIASINAAVESATKQARSSEDLGQEMGRKAAAATKDVEAAGQHAYGALLTTVPLGQAEAAGAKSAQHAAVTILSAQKARLDAQPAPAADKAEQAAANVHAAAVNAATKVADAAAPTAAGWLSGLKTILTEPKIIVPLLLFAATVSLGILLGLGVIHVASVCKLTITPAKESLCARYATLASQASNVLISLAAATVGALVGIFAGHPGEQPNPSAPKAG